MPTISMTAMPLSKRFLIANILIALLLLLAFFLRLTPVFNNSVHFSFDQGLDILMVRELVDSHHLNLISRYSGLQGVLMGPAWTWFLAVPFILSGGNPAGSVVALVLLSVICSLITFRILHRILGKSIAYLTLLFMLFAPSFFGHSQIALSPHPLIYLFFFYLYFCYQIFFRAKEKYWLPLGLLIGIFFQLEIAFALFTIPTLLTLILISKSFRSVFSKYFLLGSVIFLATFLPQLVFDLRHNFLISKSLLGFLSGDKNSLYKESVPLMVRMSQRLVSFNEDLISMGFFVKPLSLTAAGVVVAIFGWVKIFRQRLRPHLAFLTIVSATLGTFFVGFVLYPGPIWGWYRAGLPICYVLLLTIPYGYLHKQGTFWKTISVALLFVFLYQAAQPIINMWESRNKIQAGANALSSQKEILDQIYKDAEGSEFSYYVYTPPVYDYIWQYQFAWYGKKTYGYLPKNFSVNVPLLGIGEQSTPPTKGQGLVYLIIEPDSERPWQRSSWPQSYIKLGKTVMTKDFNSGITLEKRIVE